MAIACRGKGEVEPQGAATLRAPRSAPSPGGRRSGILADGTVVSYGVQEIFP